MRPLSGALLLSLVLTISAVTSVSAEELAAVPAASASTTATTEMLRTRTTKQKRVKETKAVEKSSSSSESSDSEKSSADKSVDKGADKKDKVSAAPPARFASFIVGSVVGTPVAMARKMKSETISATRDLVGDTDNKFLLGAGGFLGVPAGIISGFFQGPVYGVFDAWKGSKDEPFGADAFSLGDLK